MINNYTIQESFDLIQNHANGKPFYLDVTEAITFAYLYAIEGEEISNPSHQLIENVFTPLGRGNLNQAELVINNISPIGSKPQVLAPINNLHEQYLFRYHTSPASV